MNALCWLGLSAVTWYLAGLYQMEILGIIVLIQIFLFVSMFVISLYLRDKISGTIFVKNGFEERGQEAEGVLRLSNRGRIPMRLDSVHRFDGIIVFFRQKDGQR